MDSDTSTLNAEKRCTVGKLDLAAEARTTTDIERSAAASHQQTAQIEQIYEAVQRLSGGSTD